MSETVTPELIAAKYAAGDYIFSTYISITDLKRNWVPNQWIGSKIKIVKGTGYGQVRTVISNTNVTLYIARESYDGYTDGEPWEILPGTDYVLQGIGGWTKGWFCSRDRAIGSKQINQNEILFSKIDTYEIWDKYADGVSVQWNDGVNSGVEKYGDCRVGKKILSITNDLIQNQFLARSLAKQTYTYVSVKRRMIKSFQTIPLLQVEIQDEVKPVIQDIVGLNIWYIVDKIKLSLKDGIQDMWLVQK